MRDTPDQKRCELGYPGCTVTNPTLVPDRYSEVVFGESGKQVMACQWCATQRDKDI